MDDTTTGSPRGILQLKYYGHNDVRLMNGGRRKWLEEKTRALSTTRRNSADHILGEVSETPIARSAKIFFSVLEKRSAAQLVNVRSPDELPAR